MMKPLLSLIALLCFISSQAAPPADAPALPVPSPAQLRWHEAELGAVFHYDLHVFDGIRYGQGNNRIQPIADYNIFSPDSLDTDQWILAAKAAGCRFAVLTATHETGFGLWQSDVNPYCLKALRWRDGRADIVRDFVNSCRKYGLQPGIYIGIRWNSLFGIHNFEAQGSGEFARNRQQWYRAYCERITEELCTRYGPLFMIWFDGGADNPRGLGPDVEPIVAKYQPDCLFYHNADRADLRWGGSETGTVPYPCWSTFPYPFSHGNATDSQASHTQLLRHGDPDGRYWVPAMADAPLRGANGRHEWFWEPDDEDNLLPLDSLVAMYEQSVGRNATLILGLTPSPSGLIPAGDVSRLAEFGCEVNRRYGSPLGSVSGTGKSLTLRLPAPASVSAISIGEDLTGGHRVRAYTVEALVNGRWKHLCSGSAVGHRRIQRFNPVRTRSLRLKINQSIDSPLISNFSVYE